MKNMHRASKLIRLIWAFPNTLLGLLLGCIGWCFRGRVQLRMGCLEFYGGGVQWLIHRLPNGQFVLALTLGHVILGQTAAALDVSRSHEHVHVAQYERWGPFMLPIYFLSSIIIYFRGGDPYLDNIFEKEAYENDRDSSSPPDVE